MNTDTRPNGPPKAIPVKLEECLGGQKPAVCQAPTVVMISIFDLICEDGTRILLASRPGGPARRAACAA